MIFPDSARVKKSFISAQYFRISANVDLKHLYSVSVSTNNFEIDDILYVVVILRYSDKTNVTNLQWKFSANRLTSKSVNPNKSG